MVQIEQRVIDPKTPPEVGVHYMDNIREELLSAGFTPELLLPPQFTRGPFLEKIHGDVKYHFDKGVQVDAVGFTFPQLNDQVITRLYPLPGFNMQDIKDRNPGENQYSVPDIRTQNFTGRKLFTIPGTGCDIVNPSSDDAKQVLRVQKKVMGYDESSAYPYDLWLPGAGPVTQFVVLDRQNKTCVGYLLGFAAQDTNGKKWIESQVMGVIPEMENKGIAEALKREQRLEAIKQGYDLIRWTFDPLKNRNAHLNLNKLGGVIQKFLPNHYQFGENSSHNAIPASRFQVDWEITSEHVEQTLNHERYIPTYEEFVDSPNTSIIDTLNCSNSTFYDATTYLVEIPSDWELIVKNNPDNTRTWREKSDRIFSQLLNGSHIIKSEVKSSDGKYYLVAEPAGKKIKSECVTPGFLIIVLQAKKLQ